MDAIRLILVVAIIIFFIYGMSTKKISTILALPLMGMTVALIASIGLVDGDFFAWSTHPNIYGAVDEQTGEVLMQGGIMSAVIDDGTVMMAGAMVSSIFGGAFAVMLSKLGIIESVVKKVAELVGDKPLLLTVAFYIITVIIFGAVSGLGPMILVGSIALPILISVGLKSRDAAIVVLLGMTAGGVINPIQWATYTSLLEGTGMSSSENYTMIANMSYMIFAIVVIVSFLYILFLLRKTLFVKYFSIPTQSKNVSTLSMVSIAVPIIVILVSKIITIFDPTVDLISPEVAITCGILWALFTSKAKNKQNLLTSSFIEGINAVSGALVLFIGLGILIKGFQFYTVTPLISPFIETVVGYLHTPWIYVVGFTICTPLVLYRGPLNMYGIGGSIPTIFAAAGFSPVATIFALRALTNMQGFGDPTNSHNLWLSDFGKYENLEVTKLTFGLGIILSFLILVAGVVIAPEMLV